MMKNILRTGLFLFLTAIAGLTVAGCVSQTPVPQYSDNITFSVVYTHDDVMNLTSQAINDNTASALNAVVTDRNLKINAIDFKAIESDMNAVRDTERRIQLLRSYAKNSQIILLNEISTEFYSALSGRYRWNVDVHISIYDMITRNTLEDSFTIPAVLMYSHENGTDAIESVQAEIQRKMGGMIDAFLKGRIVRNDAPVVKPEPSPAPVVQPVVSSDAVFGSAENTTQSDSNAQMTE